MTPAASQNTTSALADRDHEIAERIRGRQKADEATARELFFDHFDRLEGVIRRRLCHGGLNYDDGSEHYNAVFAVVYEKVYSPDALPRSVADFDAERGGLANWLLNRAGFVIQDWLKANRRRRVVSYTSQHMEPAAEDPDPAAEPSGPNVFEEALLALTPPQRACAALRVLPARLPTEGDVEAMSECSGRPVGDLQSDIAEVQQQRRDASVGQRQWELEAELTAWHMRRGHQGRMYERLRQRLRELGEAESVLDQLKADGSKSTHEQIQQKYRRLRAKGAIGHRRLSLRERLETCCRELERCSRRLDQLGRQYAGAGALALLEYAEIARILGSTEQKVTAYLHRARQRIEQMQRSRKAEG